MTNRYISNYEIIQRKTKLRDVALAAVIGISFGVCAALWFMDITLAQWINESAAFYCTK